MAEEKRTELDEARQRLRACGATHVYETTDIRPTNGRGPESISEFDRQARLRRQWALDNGENEDLAEVG